MSKAQGIAQSANQGQFKNRIINGAMTISQRNGTSSITPSAETYTLDRWSVEMSASSKYSVQQDAGGVTPPVGFIDYLGITSTSAYSVNSGDFFGIFQVIEGFNIADLGWGTASASPVTISFWVRSSLTGTFGGALENSAGNRSYPFSYTISAANTWEQKAITIVGDTTGTWLTNNGRGITLRFGLGVGSTYSGTAGSWSSSRFFSATGATSVVGTNGATFYITGVQLEKGSTATSFDYRPYGTELALCQRYFEKVDSYDANSGFWSGQVTSGQTYFTTIPYCVTKRAGATITIDGASNSNFGSITSSGASISGFRTSAVATTTASVGYFRAIWSASAEL